MNTSNIGPCALPTSTVVAFLSLLGFGATNAEAQVRPSIAGLQTRIATLETQVAEGIVPNLAGYVAMDLSNPSRPTVRVSGANLEIVNGLGSTGTVNGLGNLIVGYNEARPVSDIPECSFGPQFNEGEFGCTLGIYANNFRLGSHNVVIGSQQNYSTYGGLLAGFHNTVVGPAGFQSISGGTRGVAWGTNASISGGELNYATGTNSSVSGGRLNQANGWAASVSGGQFNRAGSTDVFGQGASVSGGSNNIASGTNSSVSGGLSNQATFGQASVSGGTLNVASGTNSSVSGGSSRSATATSTWRAGTLSSVP